MNRTRILSIVANLFDKFNANEEISDHQVHRLAQWKCAAKKRLDAKYAAEALDNSEEYINLTEQTK